LDVFYNALLYPDGLDEIVLDSQKEFHSSSSFGTPLHTLTLRHQGNKIRTTPSAAKASERGDEFLCKVAFVSWMLHIICLVVASVTVTKSVYFFTNQPQLVITVAVLAVTIT
jgi:hypothetical protein